MMVQYCCDSGSTNKLFFMNEAIKQNMTAFYLPRERTIYHNYHSLFSLVNGDIFSNF